MFGLNLEATRYLALTAIATVTFTAAAVAGTVSISSPGSGATVTSPFHLVASANSSYAITGMAVYVNGSKVAGATSTGKVDKYISTSTGSKRITVQGFDRTGVFSKTINITVSTSSSSSGSDSKTTGKTYYNIDQMSGWQHCTVCAGTNGSGSTASYSMHQWISSPSMDGKSVKFSLGGSTPYSNALWWKQLGANSSARHFVYDTYVYLKTPSASQALEFDVNQSTGGKKYIFGTQCSMTRGTFDIYSAASKWIHTSIPCTAFKTAYKWHHLTWEFERTTGRNVKFVSVTLNGKKHYINKTYSPKSSSTNEINVAYQMDGNKYQTDYTTWLDKVKLRYW